MGWGNAAAGPRLHDNWVLPETEGQKHSRLRDFLLHGKRWPQEGHLGRVQHPVALQWSRGSLYSWLTLLMMNCASGEGNAFKTAG